MRTTNPTALSIGQSGNIAGQQWRVMGRVVIGMEYAGEFYSWQEFNLASHDQRESATLVYEETEEEGPSWKFFSAFDPSKSITAEEASRYRLGESYLVDGKSARITLVDESRVYSIEGTAPEGVEVGDVAHFFNAETADTMIVVSWTGDEVEHFHGTTLDPATVARAFGFTETQASTSSFRSAAPTGVPNIAKLIGWSVVVFVVVLIGAQMCASPKKSYVTPPPPAPLAPVPTLGLGTSGTIVDTSYRIMGQAVMELSAPGKKRICYDYQLVAADYKHAILRCTCEPGKRVWLLLHDTTAPAELTPSAVAQLATGSIVQALGVSTTVEQLYRLTVRSTEGEIPSHYTLDQYTYHLIASDTRTRTHLSWQNSALWAQTEQPISEQTIKSAFSQLQ